MKKNYKDKYERIIKVRRVMAMVGVIVIALLYVYFFFLAAVNDPNMMNALFTAFAATIIVPVIMYALGLLAKNMSNYMSDEEIPNDKDEQKDDI